MDRLQHSTQNSKLPYKIKGSPSEAQSKLIEYHSQIPLIRISITEGTLCAEENAFNFEWIPITLHGILNGILETIWIQLRMELFMLKRVLSMLNGLRSIQNGTLEGILET